jgi:hypothetical protein
MLALKANHNLQARFSSIPQLRSVSTVKRTMRHISNLSLSNHPIIKDDGLLAVFLTEASFETWRKHSTISYEEESASKRVDSAEEMSIPSDLDEKLAYASPKPIPIISLRTFLSS